MSRADAVHRGGSEVVVFGRRAVMEAIAEPLVEVGEVRVARDVPGEFRKELADACRARGADAPMVTDGVGVRELSHEPRHDQGVAARVRLTTIVGVESFTASLTGAAAAAPTRVLAMDAVTNPQNIGMIVRSAVASGMSAVLWPMVGSPWIDGLIVKSSASAIYRCTIATCGTLAEGLWELKRAGFTLYGLSAGATTNLFDRKPAHRAAFILGSETEGLARETEELLDERLSIPMRNGIESLNVAVTAGLVCFHAAR
ncbi:MAG TPA: TrmH family RNA methyltransferase [Phycisphaerales bacterium]|nr:TrmH family RNA methyltransferase [Phycisphaerales bacterium]